MVNPQGPLVRQAKLVVTRRLSNVIMVRGALYTYEKEKRLDGFLICEMLENGFWQKVGEFHKSVEQTENLEVYHPFSCDPEKLYRIVGFFMVNNTYEKEEPAQRLFVQAMGIWNVWGREDGYDEPKSTPVELFYDGISLPPVEERKYARTEKPESRTTEETSYEQLFRQQQDLFLRKGSRRLNSWKNP